MDVTPFDRDLSVRGPVGFVEGVQAAARIAKRARQAYDVARQLEPEFRSGNTASRFQSRIGPHRSSWSQDIRDFRSIWGRASSRVGGGRMQIDARDPTRFQPVTYLKSRGGRKRSRIARVNRIIKSVTVPCRFRFQNQTGISVPNGAEWMTDTQAQLSSTAGAEIHRTLPVCLFLLNGIIQGTPGGTAPFFTNSSYPGFHLVKNKAVAERYKWLAIQGQQPNGAGATYTLQYENTDTASATNPSIGRKSYWDWSRAKLTLYGKLYEQTRYTISIVKFLDDEYNPLYSGNGWTNGTGAGWPQDVRFSDNLSARAAQFYGLMCHKLMNNPSSSAYNPISKRKVMKVLKSFSVTLDPVVTTERAGGDTTTLVPHMRCLDIFNRWGRIVDYKNPAATDVPSLAELQAPNWYPERSA